MRGRKLRLRKFCLMFFFSLCFIGGLLASACFPSAAADDPAAPEFKNRIELSGSYEYLSPNGDYGNWGTFTAAFYRKERPDFTWFAQIQTYTRPEGTGLLGNVGAYKDWTSGFYTYTSVAAGTDVEYLPQIRVDHDFNFKFGPDKKFVWILGGTYIGYYDVHRDYILSTGFMAYLGDWVAEYRIFRNLSSPGWVESYSHLFSLAYGQEGRHWTTANFSFGKQAYLATSLAEPEAVSNNSYLVSVNHRQWLAKNYGVFGELSYFDLQSTYKKGGFLFGGFWEF